MKISSFLYLAGFGIKSILLKKKEPILGTIIVTDKRNKYVKNKNMTAMSKNQ